MLWSQIHLTNHAINLHWNHKKVIYIEAEITEKKCGVEY